MGIFRVIKILSLFSQRMYLLKQLKTEISRPWRWTVAWCLHSRTTHT